MFLKGLNKNWKNAYRAEARFYSGNNNIFGVFALTENTDTIFHRNPRAKVDGREVKVWRMLLVPLQGEALGDVDFYKALEYFEKIKCDTKGEEILVKGFSKQELEKIMQFCN